MNYKRHKPRRQVRCSLCTPNRLGNGWRKRSPAENRELQEDKDREDDADFVIICLPMYEGLLTPLPSYLFPPSAFDALWRTPEGNWMVDSSNWDWA